MISRITTSATLCLALTLTMLLSAGCGPKADLRLRLKQGDKRSVHVVNTMSMAPSIAGQKMEMGQTTEMTCRFDFESIEPSGEGKAKATFEQVEQNSFMTMAGAAMPGLEALTGGAGKAFRAIQGESFTCAIAADGKVSGVQGMAAVAKKAASNLDIPDGPMKAMMKPMLETQLNAALSDATMEAMWTSAMDIYPGKIVRVNESWTKEYNAKGQGMVQAPVKVSQKLTLKSIQAGTATIDMTGMISAEDFSGGGMPFKLKDLKGDATGTIDVDIATGWIKRAHSEIKITAALDLSGLAAMMPGAKSGDTTITMEIKSNVDTNEAS